jgi:hypothetical protein
MCGDVGHPFERVLESAHIDGGRDRQTEERHG